MLEDAVADTDEWDDDDEDDDDDEADVSTYDDPYNNQIYMSEEAVGDDSLDTNLDSLESSADLDDDFMLQLQSLTQDLNKMADDGSSVQDLVGEGEEAGENGVGTYDDPYNNQNYMTESEVGEESREMEEYRRFLKHREFETFQLFADHGPAPDEEAVGSYLDDDNQDDTFLNDGFEDKFAHLGDGAVSMSDVDNAMEDATVQLPEKMSKSRKETNVSKRKHDDDDDDDDDESADSFDPDAAEEAKYKKLRRKRSLEKAVSSSDDDLVSRFLNDPFAGQERRHKSSALEKLAVAEGLLPDESELDVNFDETAVGQGRRRRGGIPKEGMVAWFQYSNFDEKKQEWKSSLGEGFEEHKMVLNTGKAYTLEAREF
eukprot:UN04792